MNSVNETVSSSGVIYWALNDYGVTSFDLFINTVIVLLAGWIIGLNLLVLHTLLTGSRLSREPADIFVCSLAVSDALSGVFLLYNTSYNLTNYQVFHECMFRLGLIQVLGLASVFHMVALTVDRYIKILHPYHYTTLCRRLSVITASTVIWFVCLTIGLLPLMGWHKERLVSSDPALEPVCGFFAVFNHSYLKLVVSLFWFPSLIMIGLYLHIFKIARRHARLIAVQGVQDKSGKTKESHSWKYTKTVCLIIGIYFLSWLPAGVVIMLDFWDNLGDRTTVEKGTLLLYASSVAYLNSLANPIIYAFKITSVRLRFRSVFCRKSVQLSEMEESRTEAPGDKGRRPVQGTTLANTVISEIDISE